MIEKIRGTLYGALAGDCFGALFQENSILTKGSRLVLRNFLDSLEKQTAIVGLRKSYTDVTALTLAVGRTLEACKQIDQKILAQNFVEEFYKNIYRGYNAQTVEIFAKLKHTHFDDVLFPAKEAVYIDGGDNGGATYIAPIALICVKNPALNLDEQVRTAVAVTHRHEMALSGAILQANAIHNLIQTKGHLNSEHFIDQLIDSLRSSIAKTDGPSFVDQLQHLKKLLSVSNPSEERIVNVLGHSSQAIYSVPTGLYCFLRGINHQNQPNIFRQSIEYAIALGGHSNSIASMTGALCGAYYGDAVISQNTLKQCEGFDEITEISQNLYTS